jgi:hypothetical protein
MPVSGAKTSGSQAFSQVLKNHLRHIPLMMISLSVGGFKPSLDYNLIEK